MSACRLTEDWSSPAWRQRAVTWLDEQLASAGIARTGAVEQPHLRPWATVLQAPTESGTVWLKAGGQGTAFEAGLYELLTGVAPGHVLEPLAVDVERGWILLPDGGPSIGERIDGAGLPDAVAAVLPQYAELQRAVAPHAGRLLDLGLADMRAAAMPQRFEEALAAVRPYVEERRAPSHREAYERLTGFKDTIAGWSERLAAAPGGASIDHNDLHPWNMLFGAGGGIASARFYDWGDSVVAHPFASMLVALGFLRFRVLEPDDTAPLLRARDAYLEVFTDVASRSELVETLELACRVGKVARALTWQRAVSALAPDEVDARWTAAPFESLVSLFDESYLGRT